MEETIFFTAPSDPSRTPKRSRIISTTSSARSNTEYFLDLPRKYSSAAQAESDFGRRVKSSFEPRVPADTRRQARPTTLSSFAPRRIARSPYPRPVGRQATRATLHGGEHRLPGEPRNRQAIVAR